MASTLPLPAELVEEILLRVPPDEPAHLVHATVVCKAWHSILSNHGFLCRYRRFHGTPPLLGYICSCSKLTVQFVPTMSIAASPVRTQALNCSGRIPSTMDCRHGRVLIKARVDSGLVDRLIVWDPITDRQHHLILPTYLHSPYNHEGAVLCAKDGCDHLDCHGGAFRVVLLGMSHGNNGVHTWASVYSSETGAWSARTPNDITNQYIYDTRCTVLTGDALYFPTIFRAYNILKYDLCKHELSVMDTPGEGCPILIKGDDGALGVAAILHNCIYMWSWKVGIKGVGEWVKYKVVQLDDTPLPKGGRRRDLICMAEGTNTVFIGIEHKGIFMLDLKSKQVRKLGERKTHIYGLILPYMSFYTPKY